MQVNVESITQYVKCTPYKPIPSHAVCSIVELLDFWLPPILPTIIKEDFLEFFTSKVTGKIRWLRSCIDSSFTSFKVRFDLGGYRGLPDFIFWDDNLDGHFLEQILPLLHIIANCTNSPLNAEQFVAIATDLCQWANFRLNSLDIRIITTICQMPSITIPALTRLLHLSYKKVRTRWKRLRRLNIFRVTALPNYLNIGLQPVIIEIRDSQRILGNPFLLSKIRLTGGRNQVLHTMVVPQEQLETLTRCLKQQTGTAHTLYLAKSLGHSIVFTNYQIDRDYWDINWRRLFIGAHLLHHDQKENKYMDFFESENPPIHPYILDEKDKRLIPVLMSDAHMKLELLASTLHMSLSQVSRRKTKLLELGVLRLEPIMRRVGLIEDIVIRISEEDPRLLGILEELPQIWTIQLTEIRTGKKQILVYTTLPAGSFAKIQYYIRRYLQSKPEIFLCGPESGGWPLSFETYDSERGIWKWQEPIVEREETENIISVQRLLDSSERSRAVGGRF